MIHHGESSLYMIMMQCGALYQGEISWFIMMNLHDASRWCIMMALHGASRWFIMMDHHNSPCWIITLPHNELSWFITFSDDDSWWWILTIHHDELWWFTTTTHCMTLKWFLSGLSRPCLPWAQRINATRHFPSPWHLHGAHGIFPSWDRPMQQPRGNPQTEHLIAIWQILWFTGFPLKHLHFVT